MRTEAVSLIKKTIEIGKKAVSEHFPQRAFSTKPILCLAPVPNIDTLEVTTNYASRIKNLSQSGFESTSLKTLFSSRFKPKRRFNEDGNRVTTIIDRLTHEPVEMIVKPCPYGYKFYVKDAKEIEEKIGYVYYTADEKLGTVYIDGMMNSQKNLYSGVGIRGHQIAVEEAMLHNSDCVELESIPKAIPFHTKSLFRIADSKKFSKSDFEEIFSRIAEENNISFNEIKKYLEYKEEGDLIILSSKSMENLKKKDYIKTMSPMMRLDGDCLSLWKDMCKFQPILL